MVSCALHSGLWRAGLGSSVSMMGFSEGLVGDFESVVTPSGGMLRVL